MSMKNTVALLTLLIFAISGCSPTATAEPINIEATAESLALTMVAQTAAMLPSATPVPPTETITPVPPTETPLPPTNTLEPTSTPTGTATSLPTAINRYDRDAPLRLVNESDHTVDLHISGPAYFHETFKLDNTITVPLGTYTFVAYVGNRTFSGTMFINNPDKWTLVFFNNNYSFRSP